MRRGPLEALRVTREVNRPSAAREQNPVVALDRGARDCVGDELLLNGVARDVVAVCRHLTEVDETADELPRGTHRVVVRDVDLVTIRIRRADIAALRDRLIDARCGGLDLEQCSFSKNGGTCHSLVLQRKRRAKRRAVRKLFLLR
jgi:hypothetical protein